MSRSYALSINALFVFDMYDLIRALFLKVSSHFYLLISNVKLTLSSFSNGLPF